jgi:membrane-bound lytic murein transglycosylase D
MDYMMNFHADHAIHPEKWVKKISADTIQVKGYLNLKRLQYFTNITPDTFRAINPHLVSHSLPKDNRTVVIYIPSSRMALLKANRQAILDSASYLNQSQVDSLASLFTEKLVKRRYKVKRSQSVYEVARVLHVSVLELKHLNQLKSNRVKRGKQLFYYARVREKVMQQTIDSNQVAELPMAKRKKTITKIRYYKVRSGDTLSDIAVRYHGLTVAKLKKLNRMRASSTLRPGMRLRIS